MANGKRLLARRACGYPWGSAYDRFPMGNRNAVNPVIFTFGFEGNSKETQLREKSMTAQRFHGSRLKIKRAKRHVNELNTRIVEFLASDFYSLRFEEDADTGDIIVKCNFTKPIPEEIPLIIGDIIHNLRTALDFATSEIVRNAGLDPTHVYFPFHETRRNLIDSLEKGKLKIAEPKVCDLICNVIKPYKAGNFSLWAINKLDVSDKHKLLIPVIFVSTISDVCIVDNNYYNFGNLATGISLDGFIRSSNNYEQPSFQILFDKGQVFEGQPIVQTLQHLVEIVDGIIGILDTVAPQPCKTYQKKKGGGRKKSGTAKAKK